MKIKRTIEVDIRMEGTKGLSCGDGATLGLLFGSQSVVADMRLYGITKIKNRYHFSIDTLSERLVTLKERSKKWTDRAEVLGSVIKELEGEDGAR